MKTIFTKIAAVLAFVIGGMAVFAGGRVLLGQMPDYHVINWLPLYNYTFGILTMFITAALIWTNRRLAWLAALGTFAFHGLVLIILLTAYRAVVAPDSLRAMAVRLVVWVLVLVLMGVQAWQNRPAGSSGAAASPAAS